MAVSNVFIVFVAFLAPLCGGGASGQAVVPSGEEFSLPVGTELAERIDGMISRLGSPKYKEREDATTGLIEIGAPAFARLRRAYRATDQLEVRLRIERIVYAAYLDYHLFDRNGFLGISQEPVPRLHEDDPRIPEGHFGVQVREVIAGTAADEAGIEAGDIIIALEGRPLAGERVKAAASFGEAIRVLGPGTRVKVTVLRRAAQLEIEAVLDKRPRVYYENQEVVSLLLAEVRDRFASWWTTHFRDQPAGRANEGEP
jgi:hypothetical protein